jgi:SH3-like domain-containing protein
MRFLPTGILILIVLLFFKAQAGNFCVTKAGANLRRSPSSSSPVSWKVPKYMPLQGTGKQQGPWAEVKDLDGETHWVSANDVTSKFHCLAVQAKMTRARSGPGRQFPPANMGLLEKYTCFKELGGEEGWTEVESDEGEKAWVNVDHMWKPTRTVRMSFE